MERYINSKTNMWLLTIGHKTLDIVSPALLKPRRLIDNQKDTAGGFIKTVEIINDETFEYTVKNWTTPAETLSSLDNKERNAVNSLKKLLNSQDKLEALVVFHQTGGRLFCPESDEFRHGNHLHIVIRSSQRISVLPEYRALIRSWSPETGIGGYYDIKKIKNDTELEKTIIYLIKDTEKFFLGTNSANMLELYKKLQDMWLSTETVGSPPELEGEEDVKHNQFTSIKFSRNLDQTDGENESRKREYPFGGPTLPAKMTQDSQRTQNLLILKNMIKENRYPKTHDELIHHVKHKDDEFNFLINMLGQGVSIFKTLFQTAFSLAEGERITLTVYDQLVDMKVDTLMDLQGKKCMSPLHSAAIVNAWCVEQNIPPMKWATVFYALTKGLIQKRVGVYLCGEANSGKSTMTTNCWQLLRHLSGQITKDAFPFQELGGKKIVIGEEVAITDTNMDNYKTLMSGGECAVARKHMAPSTCQPTMVLLNSNVSLNFNLNAADYKIMQTRIFEFNNLKKSTLLANNMYGTLNPGWVTILNGITDDHVLQLQQNSTNWTMDPFTVTHDGNTLTPVFVDDWTEFDKTIRPTFTH